jgi:conjugal transfer mating pair stabilization protein TraG
MAFEILSIGDGEVLYNAFQGAAMIFGDDHITTLVKIGFVVGFFLIAFRYLTDQEFPLRYALVGFIVYALMFVPKETVTIEDVYTGEVRNVANVPLGIAAPLSIISRMGVTMTTLFETAFSIPAEAALLENGYLNALNTLIKLRHIGTGTVGSTSDFEGDLGRTINGYIENCVMFDLEQAVGPYEVTRESLQKSDDLLAALKTTFINIDVMNYLEGNPNGLQQSCKDAYESIAAYLSGESFIERMNHYVSGLIDNKEPTETSAFDRVDQAASALSIAALDAQVYMRNALLASYLKDGPIAFIKRTGQEQLNLQWAAEQTLFNEIARPLMAFVELFTVAISPIIAFLATLGPIGMAIFVRYLQMAVWVALWGPLMAVCNLYIAITASRALALLATHSATNGAGLQAMILHDQLYQTLETWLSAGGMLAASVPALALMIVYGGSIAATNLAGRLTSAASTSVNPGRLMPDPVAIDTPIKTGPALEFSANAGAKLSGMADTQFASDALFSRSSQSALDALRSSSDSAVQSRSQLSQMSSRTGTQTSATQSIMEGVSNTINAGTAWSKSTNRALSSADKMTEAESEAVGTAVNGALNAGFITGKELVPAKLGAAVNAELLANTGVTASRAQELADVVQTVYNDLSSGGRLESSSHQNMTQHSEQAFTATEAMQAEAEQYLRQLQAVDQASHKYTESATFGNTTTTSLALPYQDLARRLVDSGAIVDINQQNDALRQKLGEDAYRQLAKDTEWEINRSSARAIMFADREALSGFLKLNKEDPVAAATLFNRYITPAAHQTGTALTPDQFNNSPRQVDPTVSLDELNAGHPPAELKRVNQAPNKAPAESIPPAVDGPLSLSQKEVHDALRNQPALSPDQISQALENGGHIDANHDKSGMMGTTLTNAWHLGHDTIHKPVAKTLDAAAKSIETLEDTLTGFAQQSLNDLRRDLGLSKQRNPENDPSHQPANDDLPPVPKK